MKLQTPELKQHELGYWEAIDKPSDEALSEYYAQKYYQTLKGNHQKQYSDEELEFYKAKVEQKEYIIHQLLPNINSKTMLDVGCGEGFDLAHFANLGWQVKGIDFSSNGMESHNPDYLPYLETGNIYDLLNSELKAGNQYSVVWLQNVLEHVKDPQDLLNQLKPLVHKNGCAVITVPNDFSELQKFAIESNKINRPFWVALPDHLAYFDYQSLNSIADYTGWQPLTTIADFPIDWYLMNHESNYIADTTKGKGAHFARLALENLIHQQPMEPVLNFFESLAKIGMGRNITIFLKPHS